MHNQHPQQAARMPPQPASPPEEDDNPAYEYDLDALQQRHQAEKQKAALIRQNIGSGTVL